MKWVDAWPVIGEDPDGDGKGEPVAKYRKPNVGREYPVQAPQTTDEFNSNKLGLQWQWHANPVDGWASLSARRGWLRLSAVQHADLWTAPNLLLQKLPSRKFTVTTRMDASRLREGDRSGLLIMGREYSYLAIVATANGLQLVRPQKPIHDLKTKSVFLRVSMSDGICEFSYSTDGNNFSPAGEPFVAKPGVWIGAKVGLFSLGQGYADYDWFRFAPHAQSAQTPARAQ